MTWRDLQQAFEKARGPFGPAEVRAQWRRWVEARTGLSYAMVALQSRDSVPLNAQYAFEQDLAALRTRKPIQQILELEYFDGHKFYVNSNVLIPRPETEELVLEAARTLPQHASVLDLGTGSGCIPVALKLRRPDVTLTGVDCSESALAVARQNAERLNASVDWLLGDLHGEPPVGLRADAVLSNPPYVTPVDPLEPEVRDFEPALALFAPHGDPLYFYRRVLHWADRVQAVQLGLECHRDYASEVADLARNSGWDSIMSADQFGAPRWVWGLKTQS